MVRRGNVPGTRSRSGDARRLGCLLALALPLAGCWMSYAELGDADRHDTPGEDLLEVDTEDGPRDRDDGRVDDGGVDDGSRDEARDESRDDGGLDDAPDDVAGDGEASSCTVDAECDDRDPCTDDSCAEDGTCRNRPIAETEPVEIASSDLAYHGLPGSAFDAGGDVVASVVVVYGGGTPYDLYVYRLSAAAEVLDGRMVGQLGVGTPGHGLATGDGGAAAAAVWQGYPGHQLTGWFLADWSGDGVTVDLSSVGREPQVVDTGSAWFVSFLDGWIQSFVLVDRFGGILAGPGPLVTEADYECRVGNLAWDGTHAVLGESPEWGSPAVLHLYLPTGEAAGVVETDLTAGTLKGVGWDGTWLHVAAFDGSGEHSLMVQRLSPDGTRRSVPIAVTDAIGAPGDDQVYVSVVRGSTILSWVGADSYPWGGRLCRVPADSTSARCFETGWWYGAAVAPGHGSSILAVTTLATSSIFKAADFEVCLPGMSGGS
jgi:hypothetical protein